MHSDTKLRTHNNKKKKKKKKKVKFVERNA